MTEAKRGGVNMFDTQSGLASQVGGVHYSHFSIQPFVFCRVNGVPHAEGEIIYHVMRHAQKNGRDDLLKAKHWIELIIEHDYPPPDDG